MHLQNFRKIAVHLTMGAAAGGLLSFELFFGVRHVNEMIVNSATPTLIMLTLGGSLTSIFAIGAALSGFVSIILYD